MLKCEITSRIPRLVRFGPVLAVAIVCALPSPAVAGPGKTVINVITDFGAVGDGIADDTAAIQAALTAAAMDTARANGTPYPSGAIVFFPEGLYRVTDTLSLSNTHGIEIVGCGTPVYDMRDTIISYHYGGFPGTPFITPVGPATGIMADFDKGPARPLFHFVGQYAHSMRDMILYGCPQHSLNRPNCSALVKTGSSGWGNSLNRYENLSLNDAVGGFLFGNDPTGGGPTFDTNNDTIICERIAAFNVDVVYKTQTPQSLNLVFRQVGAAFCTTVFDFNNGGAVSVDTVSFTDCGGTGPTDWCIKIYGQPNTGTFLFNNVRIETNTEQLLYHDGWGVTELRGILDARYYAATHPPLIAIEGGAVIVTASELVPNSSGGSIGYAPVVEFMTPAPWEFTKRTIRFRDSMLPFPGIPGSYLTNTIANLGSLPADSHWRFDGCDDRGNAPVADSKSASSW